MGLVKALAIIVSLVLIAAFFLPYRSLNEEGKTALELLRAMYSGAELERAAKEENFPLSRLDDDSPPPLNCARGIRRTLFGWRTTFLRRS